MELTKGQKLEGARMLAKKQVMTSGRITSDEIGLGDRVLTPPNGAKAGNREGIIIDLERSVYFPHEVTYYTVEHDDLKEIHTYRVPANQVKLKE